MKAIETKVAQATESLFADPIANSMKGNVKKVMKGNSSGDLWNVDPRTIRIKEGLNPRIRTPKLAEHIEWLKQEIIKIGFRKDKALACFVLRENDEDVLYVFDGHNRLQATLAAIEEGAQIETIPVIVNTTMAPEDITVAIVQSAVQKELTPYEKGIVCKRLTNYGWDTAKIADELSLTGPYVKDLLMLMSAPLVIRQMVIDESVGATLAISTMKSHGEKAIEVLQTMVARASASGKSRGSSKFMPGAKVNKAIKKQAPAMFSAVQDLRKLDIWNQLPEELRSKFEAVFDSVDKADKAEAAQAGAAQSAGSETATAEQAAQAQSNVVDMKTSTEQAEGHQERLAA